MSGYLVWGEVQLPDPDTTTDTKRSPEEGGGPSNRQTSNGTVNSASRPDSTADDYYVAASADEGCGLGVPTITKDPTLQTSLTLTPHPHILPDIGVQSFDQNGSAIEHYMQSHTQETLFVMYLGCANRPQ